MVCGRLRTERDKARVLDGLESAATESGSGLERDEIARLLGNLPPRVFVLSDVRAEQPVVFKSRQTMSYLRGPLTREEIRQLSPEKPPVLPPSPELRATQEFTETRKAPSVLPALPPDVRQYFLPAMATIEWALKRWEMPMQNDPGREQATGLRAALLGIATVRFTDRRWQRRINRRSRGLHRCLPRARA